MHTDAFRQPWSNIGDDATNDLSETDIEFRRVGTAHQFIATRLRLMVGGAHPTEKLFILKLSEVYGDD